MRVMNVAMVVLAIGVMLAGSAFADTTVAERWGTKENKDSNHVRTLPYHPTSKAAAKMMPYDGRAIESQYSASSPADQAPTPSN